MIVSKHIQSKMHKLAKLNAEARALTAEIEEYLFKKGVDTDCLRALCDTPDNQYLTDLDDGVDVTDDLVRYLEEEYKDI